MLELIRIVIHLFNEEESDGCERARQEPANPRRLRERREARSTQNRDLWVEGGSWPIRRRNRLGSAETANRNTTLI